MPNVEPLQVTDLFRTCEPASLQFETTTELKPIDYTTGQDRALQAIAYAIANRREGYNIFVTGDPGTGRRTLVKAKLEEAAMSSRMASDWAYVHNFNDPRHPLVIELPIGVGQQLSADLESFVEEIQTTLSATFDSPDYRTRREALESDFQEQQSDAMKKVHQAARRRGIRVIQSPTGLVFAPIRDGEVMSPEDFEKLPESDQKRIQGDIEKVANLLQESMQTTLERSREVRKKILELDHEMTQYAVGSLIVNLRATYSEYKAVLEYLDAVERDLVSHQEQFRRASEMGPAMMGAAPELMTSKNEESPAARRYRINLIVAHKPDGGAPIVFEDDPSHARLVGRIEHRAEFGALSTDFSLIRGGALHRANGGYLVIDAMRLLAEPFAWQALKQSLIRRSIRVESLSDRYSFASTQTLEPEPIPLNIKVILIGEPRHYYLLKAYDADFSRLFKVAADFEDTFDRTDSAVSDFCRTVAKIASDNDLLPFDRTAVARLVEESSRTAGDSEELSARADYVSDLAIESHFHAERRDSRNVTAVDVDAALRSKEQRESRLRERLEKSIERNVLLIDTDGSETGQINGLAVLQLGDYAFGRPSRITVRTSVGAGKVIDIEREAELGGPLHSKGVLILGGFIASNYGTSAPLSLSATIAFEQSYAGVDGDSASAAELYALLSAIANVPIKQCFAVTGSVNQLGEIQAIGGVNEKIEGFFNICEQRGLNGNHAVIIPRSNVRHLMLRRAVVEAVEQGKFNVYAVEHVDQGMALLTGLDAGSRDAGGEYPPETLNGRVIAGLKLLAQQRRSFASGPEHDPR